jgi:AcrR family transcriptional regulator
MAENREENGAQIDGTVEKGTKDRVIDASIDLIAQKGFDAVSMQEIADKVGIRKASLYYHFSSKDQILSEIMNYPMQQLGNMSPQDAGTEEAIVSMGLEGFLNMSSDLVLRWMEAPYVEKILRIMFVELYHDDNIKAYFSGAFINAAGSFWEQNFAIMIKHKLVRPYDPSVLAGEYLSFYTHTWFEYFLLNYGRASGTYRQEYQRRLEDHTKFIVSLLRS